jgi:hypothetical protein
MGRSTAVPFYCSYRGRFGSCSCSDSPRLTRDASFSEEFTSVQYRDNRFFPGWRKNRELYGTVLKKVKRGTLIALRKNSLTLAISYDLSA